MFCNLKKNDICNNFGYNVINIINFTVRLKLDGFIMSKTNVFQ